MNLTHSCKKVAELLTQRMDEPLGWLDRIRMRVHLSMCSNCRHVERQLSQVQALGAGLFAGGFDDDPNDTGDDGAHKATVSLPR